MKKCVTIYEKIIYAIIYLCLLIFAFTMLINITGCGHTMYHKVEGTGAYGRVPLPNGTSLVEVAIGDLNITSAALRGRCNFG